MLHCGMINGRVECVQCALKVDRRDGTDQRKIFEECSNLSYLTHLKSNK